MIQIDALDQLTANPEVANETEILFVPLNTSILDAISTLAGTMLRIRIFAKSQQSAPLLLHLLSEILMAPLRP